ncbi:MAG: HDIG domain-containing protein [Prevotellaceae bacterium]|jgi:putative nucleotidyltransferase with HDIG domain|nr:HDIG domain-containing protein [Prevotellaceae bacterium]
MKYKKYRNLVPFAAALALIVYFMPREGKFQYEFQKGKVWQHATLHAAFDFPIYKNETELANERRLTLNTAVPYYNIDSSVYRVQLSALGSEFRAALRTMRNNPNLPSHNLTATNEHNLRDRILPSLYSLLNIVYSKGIREPNSIAEGYLNAPNATLVVLAGNVVARTYPTNESFSPQDAYQFVLGRVRMMWVEGSREQAFFQELDVQRFFQPNLMFNERITTQSLEQRLLAIAPTLGMVNAGQQIVAQGEVVNDNAYRTLSSYRREYEQRVGYSGSMALLVLGQLLLVLFFLSCLYFYIKFLSDDKEPFSFKKSSFLMLLICSFFLLTLWVTRTQIVSLYVIPFAVAPVFVCTFFNTRLATFVHLLTVMLSSFIVPSPFEFCLTTTFAGLAAVYSSGQMMYRRGRLYRIAGIIFATYCVEHITLTFINDGLLTLDDWHAYLWFAINVGFVIATQPLVYVFEKVFGFTSDNTLMEISDTNNGLLRELAEAAPATFQHCIQVANLAESVVREIGGNPLLVRAGALYHDIGKMGNPIFFIENKPTNFSPHQHLEPEESARIIVQHVTNGVALARKHGLPEVVVRFIRTHHGTSQVRSFYLSYKEKHPDAVDFSDFQYPGPKPKTKEQGVLMMADAIEAASRSLSHISSKNIGELVDTVVSSQISNGMLDNCELTFGDITTAKQVLKKRLQNIYHDRIIS